MNKRIVFSFLFCILFVFCLSGCSDKYVYYHDIEIESSKLSKETIDWIEKYNAESKEVQNDIKYIPPELSTVLTEMGVEVENFIESSENVNFEKPITIISKILLIEKWTDTIVNENGEEETKELGKFLISTDDLYWCEYEDIDKLKEGYNVEIVYSEGVKEDDILTIYPDSVTIISGSYNYFSLYLEVIDALWNDKTELNEGISTVLIDFADFTYFSDKDKTALFYLLNERYGVEFKEGSEENQEDSDLVIRLYLAPSESEDFLYSLSAIKKKNESDFVKYSNTIVKSSENLLIWEKNKCSIY